MKKNQLNLFDESKFSQELERCIREQKECADWLSRNKHLPESQKRGAWMGIEDWLLAETYIRLAAKEQKIK